MRRALFGAAFACVALAGPVAAQDAAQGAAPDSGSVERLEPLNPTTGDAVQPVVTATYHCERGAEVHAAYINDTDPQRVALFLQGRLVVMSHVRSADGAKYAEDGEGEAGYVWWTKGHGAMLDWIAEDGEAQPLFRACQED
ncbi:MliC family protein [Thioclava sediminum]|uniref:MliC family protein n=1 Tax=Thioclava sediminum TaxID=1915319 RepID=UPI000995FAB2|nr:MliC family protein [Thioclava sediminum]